MGNCNENQTETVDLSRDHREENGSGNFGTQWTRETQGRETKASRNLCQKILSLFGRTGFRRDGKSPNVYRPKKDSNLWTAIIGQGLKEHTI